MSKQTGEHHCKAAERHASGSHQKATHHARLAHGYHHHATRLANSVRIFALTLVLMIFGLDARAQEPEISNKLQGFDSYIEQVLKDWNTPGIGVGIVVNDRLVFAKGDGYPDYEKKIPFT